MNHTRIGKIARLPAEVREVLGDRLQSPTQSSPIRPHPTLRPQSPPRAHPPIPARLPRLPPRTRPQNPAKSNQIQPYRQKPRTPDPGRQIADPESKPVKVSQSWSNPLLASYKVFKSNKF